MGNQRGVLLFALILASFNLRPAITSVSPVLQGITDELGMSATAASLLTSIPLVCIGLCSLIAGRLANRFQMEKVIMFFIACIGIATFLRLFTTSTVDLLLSALMTGAGIGIVSPLMSGFIKRHFPTQSTSVIGIYSTSMVVGASIAIGLTMPLQHWLNDSWKNGLAFWAIFALVALPLWGLVVRHAKEEQPMVKRSTVVLPLRDRKAWLLTLFVGLVILLFYCFTAWLPAIVEEKGWSPTHAGLVGTVAMLAQLPATLLLPVLLKIQPSRRVWMMFFTLSVIIGLSILCFTMVNPIVTSLFVGIGGGGLVSLTLLLPIDKTNSPIEASTWSAMTQAFGYMIGSIGPLLIGILHDYTGSFTSTLYLLIIMGLVVIGLGWKVTRIESAFDVTSDLEMEALVQEDVS